MGTFHEDAATAVFDRYISRPKEAEVLAATIADFRAGTYDEQYTAWIGQTQRRPAYWPVEQAAAYLYVHTQIMSGVVAKVLISVGETPGPDADREGNAAKLLGTHPPFRADLDMAQNGAGRDGTLRWGEPIRMERSTGTAFVDEHGVHSPVGALYEVLPYSAPLEVGYTQPSRTMAHLAMEGAVARWAYDDDCICLMFNVQRLGRSFGVRPLPVGIEPFSFL